MIMASTAVAQRPAAVSGDIGGTIQDEKQRPVKEGTVELVPLADSLQKKTMISDRDGSFAFNNINEGWYRLRVSYIGYQALVIDSLHVRADHPSFMLGTLVLKDPSASQLQEVVIYAEKPLVQSKNGNITFNASESPLSAGSSASDLLQNVPLIAKDPDGKVSVRGKEPKILIDDKPVELNAQQLQTFLESLPGSMIERIEVMTNPPPQYANEQGGVINIVMRKGTVGLGGRVDVSAGTRGDGRANGNINFRKKGLAINFNAGVGSGRYYGDGYALRQNLYPDSTNYFNSTYQYNNRNLYPSGRLSVDYDLDPRNSLSFVTQFNQNLYHNHNISTYTSLDHTSTVYKASRRITGSEGEGDNPMANLSFTHRGRKAGEILRFIVGANRSHNKGERIFNQEFLNPDSSPNGIDSTQKQLNDNHDQGYNGRLTYDKLLDNNTTFISTGGFFNYNTSHVILNSMQLQPGNVYVKNDLLSSDFNFRQQVGNLRFSVRQKIGSQFSVTGGLSAENTQIDFRMEQSKQQVHNDYWTWLPFANIRQDWPDVLNISLAYRRSINRPGIMQLNPTIDYGDPYNLRFGNPYLAASTAHNFDLVFGRSNSQYYSNVAFGYNIVQKVFSIIRTLRPDGTTQITWQNLDDRHQYDISTWSGYNFSRKLRINFSASYSFNEYSEFDKAVNRYRDGGSLTTNLNTGYSPKDVWNFNGNFTYNRFANPQGTVHSTLSMNIGIQRKFFNKRFIVTANAIDPLVQQENRTFTYGPNFNVESYSLNETRNFRLTLAYNFRQGMGRARSRKAELKSLMEKKG